MLAERQLQFPVTSDTRPTADVEPVDLVAANRPFDRLDRQLHDLQQRHCQVPGALAPGRLQVQHHLTGGVALHPHVGQRLVGDAAAQLFQRLAILNAGERRACCNPACARTASGSIPSPWLLSAPRPADAGRPPWGSSKVAKPHLLERREALFSITGACYFAMTSLQLTEAIRTVLAVKWGGA